MTQFGVDDDIDDDQAVKTEDESLQPLGVRTLKDPKQNANGEKMTVSMITFSPGNQEIPLADVIKWRKDGQKEIL